MLSIDLRYAFDKHQGVVTVGQAKNLSEARSFIKTLSEFVNQEVVCIRAYDVALMKEVVAYRRFMGNWTWVIPNSDESAGL